MNYYLISQKIKGKLITGYNDTDIEGKARVPFRVISCVFKVKIPNHPVAWSNAAAKSSFLAHSRLQYTNRLFGFD